MAYLGKTFEFKLHYGAYPELFRLAKRLRKTMTPAEKEMWKALRNRYCEGLKFRRQHPAGLFIVDFFCLEKGLVIEIDGGIHSGSAKQETDLNRTAELERYGLKVLRFSNEEVMQNMDGVIRKIEETIGPPPSSPSP